MSETEVVFRTRGLTKVYDTGEVRVYALAGVDLELFSGELAVLLGPSGSGKTSTVTEAVERVIFANEMIPEVDLNRKKEARLASEPFWKRLEEVDPDRFSSGAQFARRDFKAAVANRQRDVGVRFGHAVRLLGDRQVQQHAEFSVRRRGRMKDAIGLHVALDDVMARLEVHRRLAEPTG